MCQPPISCIGLCDFRRPGVRQPLHREVIVEHLHLWLWHNGWDGITKKHLRQFEFRTLIGMLHALADGRGSYLMEDLLRQNGYNVSTAGLVAEGLKGVQQFELPFHN